MGNVLCNILLSRLKQYVNEIIWASHYILRRNRSTVDQIFSIRNVLERNAQCECTVLPHSDVPMTVVGLIKTFN
jgi:hypothetical protein